MRRQIIITLIIMNSGLVCGQSVVFLHHSTGGNVYNEGNVSEFIRNYNEQNSTYIQLSERAYPNSPYPWSNYAYDYWNLWINGECDNASEGIECLESIAASNDIIIFKHCYPGASLQLDNGEGDVESAARTLANYKLQYRALRGKMDEFPDNKFIVWTLAPLHRLATSADQALRAGAFVDWVKNEWLQEDSQAHPNIFVFDFFGLVAEQEEFPSNGFQYCLKYAYERSHESSDSHPNTLANETAGPAFAQFIIDVAIGNANSAGFQSAETGLLTAYPNPGKGLVQLKGDLKGSKEAVLYNMLGEKVASVQIEGRQFDISDLQDGIYFLKTAQQVLRIVKE